MVRSKVEAYTHPAPPSQQAPDPAPGNYYVSVRDGNRLGLLAGPFVNDHASALAMVDQVRKVAQDVDPRAVFYAFGTVRMAGTYMTPGKLHDLLGLPT